MKKWVALVLFLLITVISTTIHADQWAKTYGGTDTDWANSIQETSDGGYAWAGLSASFTGDNPDAWVVKTDINGDISWEKGYGGSENDWASSIQETTDGCIVAGYTESFGAGGADAWIIKLDSSGGVVWEKAYGDLGSEEFYSVQEVTSGGYIAAGRTDSFGDGDSDIWILKLADNGTIEWKNSYEGSDLDMANCIQETSDGGYIVAGDTWFTASGANINSDIVVLKLYADGTVDWQKTYGDPLDNDNASCIQQTTDGGYIVAGASRAFGGISNIWVLKLDSTGSITWQKIYGSGSVNAWASASSIKETSDLDYIVAGYTYDYGAGASDFWVLKLEGEGVTAGDIVWQKTYGGSDNDWAYSIQVTSTNEYLVAGRTRSYGAGYDDAFILKLNSSGDIPPPDECSIIGISTATASDTYVSAEDSYLIESVTNPIITDTNALVSDTSAEISTVCPYIGEDSDSDGIIDEEDNCHETPNGPNGGTCTSGTIGETCMVDGECGDSGFCSIDQEDTYPPDGNDIGDACDCEGDFDCDGDVDGTDASAFKEDFGRSSMTNPCTDIDPCNGDFICDGDVDGTDASKFKEDFGRSSFINPCPACIAGAWCAY